MNNTAIAINAVDTDAMVSNVPVEELLPDACREPKRSNSKELFYLVYATDLFGIPELDPKMIVPVFKKQTPYRAPLNKDYIPNPRILEQVVKLLVTTNLDLSLCLKGESGSGKTEMAMYISHMMNWPLTIKQINSNIRADELEGERSLIDGNTGFVLSELVKGFRDGHLILLDEIDKIDPDTAAKLHMPIERKPWSVSANGGEVVHPSEFTRFMGTANTNMNGGARRFVSSQRQDAAFIKRFLIVEMERPDEVFLTGVLMQRFNHLPAAVVSKFVSTAVSVNNIGVEDCVMDLRQLVTWVATSLTLSNLALLKTFEIAFSAALPLHANELVTEAIDLVLGDVKNSSMGDLLAKK
ncbi:AAA family ATPase [Enterobacter cloacae complex sp. ECC445]|uniref:ATP-binding protein n=1 Tax=Enterobacter cloacae complex sp. ECC445 TaxID=2913213 RepID=UPI001F158B17|nr:AAA family ATPase [Enterobacter cloacae complex sp. ECC445]MCG0456611.1 AAA family ATPase [Enterobacter cloacae complex sp. ECC445]